jgi:hypothetical protein
MMLDRATGGEAMTAPERGGCSPEDDVAPEMVDVGVQTYYENAIWGWDNPGNKELREMVVAIYKAMSSYRRGQ